MDINEETNIQKMEPISPVNTNDEILAISEYFLSLGPEILTGLVVVFIAFLIVFFRKKSNIFLKKFLGWFKVIPFENRNNYFVYRQSVQQITVCPNDQKQLRHQTLLGEIQTPSSYGVYDSNNNAPLINPNLRQLGTQKKQLIKLSKKITRPYRLKIGSDDWKDSVKAEYLIQKSILPALKSDKPKLLLVTGKVGCGKSTLIRDISIKLTTSNSSSNRTGSIATIVIDVRNLLYNQFQFNKNFHETIVNPELPKKIEDCLKKEIVATLKKIKIPKIKADTDYDDARQLCYEKQISPLIIFDEIDYLYTDFSKRSISNKEGLDSSCIEMFKKIFVNICKFHEDPHSPKIPGCNTVFIVVARSSTAKLVKEMVDDPNLINNILHIKIDEANKKTINDIVVAQLNLLKVSLQGDADRNINELIGNFSKKIDYSKNLAVSVHGARHLMNAIAKIGSHDNNYELLKLVAGHPGLLRLYQYIDGNPDYSQSAEGISNIYLVNRDYPRKCKEVKCNINHFDDWLLEEHLQSYWLKYFMCEYLLEKTKDESNRSIYFDHFVEIFHSKHAEEKTQYEESIVKLALLHASKVDHGRLVKFGFQAGEGKNIFPSSRLKFMKKENLFWDFGYLMVVIEDKWLEFPKELYDGFKHKDTQTVFHFITTYHSANKTDKVNFLEYKVRQVLTFFWVLSEALKFEKIRYESVFKRLNDGGINIDLLADFETHLKKSILNFTGTYLDKDARKNINNYIKNFEAKEKKSLTHNIKICFSKYHHKPSFRSIESKMELYYSKKV